MGMSNTTSTPIGTNDEFQTNTYSLWIFGFVILHLSFAGSSFVAIRIIHRWRKSSLSSLAIRLPLYFCILDLFQYGLYSATGIILFSSGSLPSGISCRVIGGFICFVASLNILLVGLVAFTTYLRVCKRIYFELGTFDWKLHLCVIIPAFIFSSLSNSEFGPDTYWCYVKRTSLVVPLINTIMFFGSLLTSAICYAFVALALRRATAILPQTSSRPENFEIQIYKKIISYVLMFLLNWILAFPYMLSFSYKKQASLVAFYLCMIACCWGGILNVIVYIYNEGLQPKNMSSWGSQISGQREPPRHQWQLDTEEIVLKLEERKPTGGHEIEPKNSDYVMWGQTHDEMAN